MKHQTYNSWVKTHTTKQAANENDTLKEIAIKLMKEYGETYDEDVDETKPGEYWLKDVKVKEIIEFFKPYLK